MGSYIYNEIKIDREVNSIPDLLDIFNEDYDNYKYRYINDFVLILDMFNSFGDLIHSDYFSVTYCDLSNGEIQCVEEELILDKFIPVYFFRDHRRKKYICDINEFDTVTLMNIETNELISKTDAAKLQMLGKFKFKGILD